MRALGHLCSLLAVLLTTSPVRAQDPWVEPAEEIAPLARRLDALDASGASSEATRRSLRYLLELSEGLSHGRRRRGSEPWLARAEGYLTAAEAGRDPYLDARGQITLRAYRSPLSERLAGYAVYVPPDYDPARAYPLVLALHGGSSNGNLFVALTLGARVPWEDYRAHWHSVHEAASSPQWIVVGPDGFGNSMWRYQGERDALDVLDDVRRNYHVDDSRLVLYGLSNGGLGSFNIGTRHAWRFAAVVPLAGAPGWLHYLGGTPRPEEQRVLEPLSAWHLLENASGTHLHAYHGQQDPGPMRPAYLSALEARARASRVPFALDWYAFGHDLVGPVHRDGHLFRREAARVAYRRPRRVQLVTGDYRANRQHWVTVERIVNYPSLARVDARAVGADVRVTTSGASAITLALDGAPLPEGPVTVTVDGSAIEADSADRLSLRRDGERWVRAAPGAATREKRPGLSGPIGDAYYEPLVHVYGTGEPSHVADLRAAAEAGARGFFATLLGFRQRVVADTELTDADLRDAHLVLYGTPGDNAVLERIAPRLPVRVLSDAVVVRGRRHEGSRLGVRFVYPNPLAPHRYVVVQAASRAEDVRAADRLPAFLPDWVLFDARHLPSERRNVWTSGTHPVAAGFFDDRWR